MPSQPEQGRCKCGKELCYGPAGGEHGDWIKCNQAPGEEPKHHLDASPVTDACKSPPTGNVADRQIAEAAKPLIYAPFPNQQWLEEHGFFPRYATFIAHFNPSRVIEMLDELEHQTGLAKKISLMHDVALKQITAAIEERQRVESQLALAVEALRKSINWAESMYQRAFPHLDGESINFTYLNAAREALSTLEPSE